MSAPESEPKKQEKVSDLINNIAPGITPEQLLEWPPDAFAVAAYVLQKTGAYLKVVQCHQWPPEVPPKIFPLLKKLSRQSPSWTRMIYSAGNAWRYHVGGHKQKTVWRRVFRHTVQAWVTQALATSQNIATADLHDNPVVDVWLQILAASDEAFAGVGYTVGDKSSDFTTRAFLNLRLGKGNSSLCTSAIRREIGGVLPKLHTPQTGVTLRSLSHYLAFYRTAEVKPRWKLLNSTAVTPTVTGQAPRNFKEEVLRQPSLNLLLAPWPLRVEPRQFQPANWSLNRSSAARYGFFEFEPQSKDESGRKLEVYLDQLHDAATKIVGPIDAVILPELAIHGMDNAERVARSFLKKEDAKFFVAGVGERGEKGHPGKNFAIWSQLALKRQITINQAKHHRWQLEKSQIESYGLGGTLNPSIRWWEHISLASRELHFLSYTPWFTAAILVCEDLARQEPISELIRMVGPSLVIALLMDGPQLSHRWPGRYATSLADDPGSSVLTLTSLGMAELSRPKGEKVNRTIALWKDQGTGVTSIELPKDAEGVVLSLSHNLIEEWTADGREDHEGSSYLSLSGVHPVVVPKSGLRAKSR